MNNGNKKASKKKIIRTEIDTSKLGKLEDLPPQEVGSKLCRRTVPGRGLCGRCGKRDQCCQRGKNFTGTLLFFLLSG